MSEVWTILKVLDWTTGRFERSGIEGARLDAQILLAHVLACPRVGLYTSFDKPLQDAELAAFRALIQRRLDGEPVAYLTGQQEFWSLPFAVDKRVLVPRPDTETLVQAVLELGETLGGSEKPLRVAEIATGSGAVSVSLAHERREWKLVATDLSEEALLVARGNAERNQCQDRIEFRQGHLCQPLQEERFSILVSNLPYISSEDMKSLSPEVLCEPKMALWGGVSGLELIDELVSVAQSNLQEQGWVALEHGYDQGEQVREIAIRAGFVDAETRSDLAGRARVTTFRAAV